MMATQPRRSGPTTPGREMSRGATRLLRYSSTSRLFSSINQTLRTLAARALRRLSLIPSQTLPDPLATRGALLPTRPLLECPRGAGWRSERWVWFWSCADDEVNPAATYCGSHHMKVFISCGSAADQVTALRLQAIAGVTGLTVYVPANTTLCKHRANATAWPSYAG